MAIKSHFTSVNLHLDRGGAIETKATLHGKSRELPAYGALSIDHLTMFVETADQGAAILAELARIVDHLREAELAAAWPEDLRGCTVRRAGVESDEEHLTGTILDRTGTLGELYAWVLWGNPAGAPSREPLEGLELVKPPATAELDEV